MTLKEKTASAIIHGRYVILAAFLILTVLAAMMISRTVINYDLARYLSEDTMTKRALKVMDEEFGETPLETDAEFSARALDLQKRIGEEIPVVMLIAVGVVLVMLLVTSHAWLEPLVILLTLAVSIIVNMGTNFIFPDVSFVTFAVCAILQLALSIDYAIMLLHAFHAYRDAGLAAKDAMREALSECFMRIASSALTTVAGLLSLLFMSFTIGFDIGMVLSKGILISMIGVFLLMPSLTLLLEKPLARTRHKPLSFGGDRLAAVIDRFKKPLAAVLILAVLGGLVLNSLNVYTFAEKSVTGDPLVLLVPGGDEDADYDRQRDLVSRVQALTRPDGTPAFGEVLSMVTTGAEALKYYTPEEAAELTGLDPALVIGFYSFSGFGDSVRADRLLAAAGAFPGLGEQLGEMTALLDEARAAFCGPHYARIALKLNFASGDPDFTANMEAVYAAADSVYGPESYYVTGNPQSTYDISHAFRGDLLKVNLITLFAILLIVSVSFRSLRMPVLLVFVIEGAIWITMGFSRLIGQPIFFISYLICLSIQMGATIDYGILLSDQYRSRRREGLAPRDALIAALKKALPTIMTSGVILIVAGFVIGKICTIYYIYSIGLLVARGALVSALLVLTLLPALLLLGDRYIIRESIR